MSLSLSCSRKGCLLEDNAIVFVRWLPPSVAAQVRLANGSMDGMPMVEGSHVHDEGIQSGSSNTKEGPVVEGNLNFKSTDCS